MVDLSHAANLTLHLFFPGMYIVLSIQALTCMILYCFRKSDEIRPLPEINQKGGDQQRLYPTLTSKYTFFFKLFCLCISFSGNLHEIRNFYLKTAKQSC